MKLHSDRNLLAQCLIAFHKVNIKLLSPSCWKQYIRHAETLNCEYVTLISGSVLLTVIFQLN